MEISKQLKNFSNRIRLNESTISTVLGAAVILVVGLLIFNYIRQNRQSQMITDQAATTQESPKVGEVVVEQTPDGKVVPKNLPMSYEVKTDDNLWKICEANYGSGYNWVDVVSENKLTNPDYLLVGQKLNLPKVEVRMPIAATTTVTITGNTYKVVKGDTLWDISVRAYGDGYKWSEVAQANNLDNPHLILVDQELKLLR
jgi:nucleoid-associated protein YgaU